MVNELFFAFFEFFPLINSNVILEVDGNRFYRSTAQPEQYQELIVEKVDTLALTNPEYIIVSTAEELGYTFYDSTRVRNNEFDNELVITGPYRPRRFNNNNPDDTANDGYYLDGIETLLDTAEGHDIKVLIGTGRNGDKALMGDIFENCDEHPSDPNSPCQDHAFKDRFGENHRLTKLRIKDLDKKYHNHPAMAGFYLTHETSRFRATKNRYYLPAAKYAKNVTGELMRSDYMVVTSPSYIYRDERNAHKNQLKDLYNSSDGIDALLYQDRMGPGVIEFGNTVKFTYNTDFAIDEGHLENYLSQIQGLHVTAQTQGTVPQMWINMESWRYHCHSDDWDVSSQLVCPDGGTDPDTPDHFPSFVARDRTFQKQIDIARNFGPIGTYEISANFQINGAKYKFKRFQRSIDFYNVRAIRLLQCFTRVDGRCVNDPN